MTPTKIQAISAAATFAVLAASLGTVSAAPARNQDAPPRSSSTGGIGHQVSGHGDDQLIAQPTPPATRQRVRHQSLPPSQSPGLSAIDAFQTRGYDEVEELLARLHDPSKPPGSDPSSRPHPMPAPVHYGQGIKRNLDDLFDNVFEARGYDEVEELLARLQDPKPQGIDRSSRPHYVEKVDPRRKQRRNLDDLFDHVFEARDYDEAEKLLARAGDDEVEEFWARGQAAPTADYMARELFFDELDELD